MEFVSGRCVCHPPTPPPLSNAVNPCPPTVKTILLVSAPLGCRPVVAVPPTTPGASNGPMTRLDCGIGRWTGAAAARSSRRSRDWRRGGSTEPRMRGFYNSPQPPARSVNYLGKSSASPPPSTEQQGDPTRQRGNAPRLRHGAQALRPRPGRECRVALCDGEGGVEDVIVIAVDGAVVVEIAVVKTEGRSVLV